MINANMRYYDFFTFGELDEYGQPQLNETIKGSVKISITNISTTIQDGARYKDATYIGLTHSSLLDDKCVVLYEGQKLKVLYIIPKGRYKQVFFKNI